MWPVDPGFSKETAFKKKNPLYVVMKFTNNFDNKNNIDLHEVFSCSQ